MVKTSSQSGIQASRLKYDYPSLDRAGLQREDPQWLAQALEHPDARSLPVWRNRNQIKGPDTSSPVAVLHSVKTHKHASEVVFLGLDGEAPVFAADYSGLDENVVTELFGAGFTDLRRVGPLLPERDAAMMAYARGMLFWHRNHRHCGLCGAATTSQKGGHLRSCSNPDCGRPSFPRTDPAVIVLVEHPGGDGGPPRCLLGRSPHFPKGMYSTLAGFVEPGESFEQTVAREVLEESGVEVEAARYFASQPWPFPSSVMIGFFARARSTEITLDDEEVVDARWFTPAEVRAGCEPDASCGLVLPQHDSIARKLIDTWLSQHPD